MKMSGNNRVSYEPRKDKIKKAEKELKVLFRLSFYFKLMRRQPRRKNTLCFCGIRGE